MLSSLPYWGLQSEINRLSIVVSVIVIKWFVSLSHHFSHLILVCVVGPVAAVAGLLKIIGIKKRIAEPMVPLLVQPEEATKVANQTGYVVGAGYAGQLHVCVWRLKVWGWRPAKYVGGNNTAALYSTYTIPRQSSSKYAWFPLPGYGRERKRSNSQRLRKNYCVRSVEHIGSLGKNIT